MPDNKTYALVLCAKQDFLRKKSKVIKTNAPNHCEAVDYFLEHHHDELIGVTVMTFCFEELEHAYGYTYSVIN